MSTGAARRGFGRDSGAAWCRFGAVVVWWLWWCRGAVVVVVVVVCFRSCFVRGVVVRFGAAIHGGAWCPVLAT